MYSKQWTQHPVNQKAVLEMYRSKAMLTSQQVADRLGTSISNVLHVLKTQMPVAERKALGALRYSASKSGTKNPHWGKRGEEAPRWKGDCDDGKGYLTRLWRGKRHFVHHIVMLEHLGLKSLPEGMDVHHIDGVPKNNSLDNLALVTKRGHKAIHFLQVKDSLSVSLKRSTLAEVVRSMTSQ